jgi:hypothetical protein
MPTAKDSSPNIKWPLPPGRPAFSVKNFFPVKIYESIRETIKTNAIWGPEHRNNPACEPYHTMTGRWTTEVFFSGEIKNFLEDSARKKWKNNKIKLKSIWLSRYQQYQGVTPYLWEHMDQGPAQYEIDVCIESNKINNWGLIVDGQRFDEEENNAIFFMGQQQAHGRPPYPVDDEEAYVILLFAMFVDPSHWMYEIDAYAEEDAPKWDKAIKKYKPDGDIRYYEYSGHAPRYDNKPDGNYLCSRGECGPCTVVPENFIDEIDGYIRLDE